MMRSFINYFQVDDFLDISFEKIETDLTMGK